MKLSTSFNRLASEGIVIKSASVNKKESLVQINWDDGSKSLYPLVYLRDSCRCSECFHPLIKQRMANISEIYKQDYQQIGEVLVSKCGTKLQIVWPDKHSSIFENKWLQALKLPDANRMANQDLVPHGMVTWGSEIAERFPRVHFQSVLDQDASLYEWLSYLRCYGVCVVNKATQNPGSVSKLGERVGHLKVTMDG